MKRRKQRTGRIGAREYTFTVVFDPLPCPAEGNARHPASGKRLGRPAKDSSSERGYQVTVPLLPGLITYGRTLAEARSMARDAIRCHLEGMQKAGEPISNERRTHTEKLRVALSA